MIGFYMKCNTGLKWVKELIFNVLKNWLHKCLLATIYWRHTLLDGDILLWHYQLPFCLETFAQRHSAQGLWENFKKFILMKNSCYEVKNSIKCTCEFFKMYYLYQLRIICDRLLLTSFPYPTQLVTSLNHVAHKNHEISMFLSFF